MYEYSTLLACLVVAGYLLIVEGVYKVRSLGGFALMFSVLTMALAVRAPLLRDAGASAPALNSYWIKIHVVAAISGSSLLALGSIITILYLVEDLLAPSSGSPAGAGAQPTVAAPRHDGSAVVPHAAGDRIADRSPRRGQMKFGSSCSGIPLLVHRMGRLVRAAEFQHFAGPRPESDLRSRSPHTSR